MRDELTERLRALRRKTRNLGQSLDEDLRRFLHDRDKVTFRRLPTSPSDEGDVNPTTTCTALMALAFSGRLKDFYKDNDMDPEAAVRLAFQSIMSFRWESSKLPEDNTFTATLALRTGSFLKYFHFLEEAKDFKHEYDACTGGYKGKTLEEVAKLIAAKIPDNLQIVTFKDENTQKTFQYPPTSTIGYWFVDAVDRFGLDLEPDFWRCLNEWNLLDFSRHSSWVSSGNDAMMDPVAMAMAACIAARLRRIFQRQEIFKEKPRMPSSVELEHAVKTLFKYQEKSGIWPKYFPLFHYPSAGANYCFSFELLEALLHEFEDAPVIETSEVICGLEKAISWCEQNRLVYRADGIDYYGWNSGGDINSLQAGKPESWATGVVHMFLMQLDAALSKALERRILDRYEARRVEPSKPDYKKWKDRLDSSIEIQGRKDTVKNLISTEIIEKVQANNDRPPTEKMNFRRSVLLFGPPGTAKTTLVKYLALAIGWPFVLIDPSDFLSEGLEKIYIRANEIFDDLMDLSRVVILFDEMDALTKRRDNNAQLDVTREFLTTSMLPKIAKLHDQAKVLFFMATNHQRDFDPAIKRSGRFDLLIHVSPPSWTEKLRGLRFFQRGEKWSSETESNLGVKLESLGGRVQDFLELFTFDEMKDFFAALAEESGETLEATINTINPERFQERVRYWGENVINLRTRVDKGEENTDLKEYKEDSKASRIQ